MFDGGFGNVSEKRGLSRKVWGIEWVYDPQRNYGNIALLLL